MSSTYNLVQDPIPGLIKTLAIPASVGFFFNTLFNVVDTWYGGRISTTALASLSLTFPIFFIIIAIGSGIGTAATALIANALGEKDQEKADLMSSQAIVFGVMVSILVALLGFVISPFLLSLLGATDSYLEIALSYINIIFGGTVFFILSNVLNSPLTAQGDTKTFRNSLIIGSVLNIFLDPWFIYGGLGLPPLGFRGIAVATILIQALICIYLGSIAVQKKCISRSCYRFFIPKAEVLKELVHHSIPASLNMLTIGIGIFIITYFISDFGKNAVAAYGIATRVEQIALLPTIGLNMSTLAIVGQNFGAQQYQRLKPTIVISIKYGLIVMLIGGGLMFVLAELLMGLFTENTAVIAIGAPYLRIAASILWAYVILFVATSALQGMKKPMYAIWVGLYRQIIGPIILFYLLVHILGWELFGIWWGIFIVTWSAALITLFYTWHQLRPFDQVSS